MPQINRIRVNNVKYNFGTQVYDDFMMRFNCRNTIYDLANGGGKSLLMLLLLQNVIPNCTLDDKQPIEKLFREGSDNTVIHSLVEWKLDSCDQKDGYKFMTTGFCARKMHHAAQDISEQEKEETGIAMAEPLTQTSQGKDNASVEYFNYCIFYREYGENDIKNLPLESNGEKITYNGLKSYLRELEKKDFHVSVKIFERKGEYQSFISNYGLYESEWEIIRGINKTEGHVRTYFETNYRSSRKVVEDLLIEEIIQKSFQNKLSVQDDEGLMAQTLLDIKDTLIKLSKKNAQIHNYDGQMQVLDDFSAYVAEYENLYSEKERLKQHMYALLLSCKSKLHAFRGKEAEREKKQTQLQEQLADEKRQVAAAEIMREIHALQDMQAEIAQTETSRDGFIRQRKEAQTQMHLYDAVKEYQEYEKLAAETVKLQTAIANSTTDHTELEQQLATLAAQMVVLGAALQKQLEADMRAESSQKEMQLQAYETFTREKDEIDKKITKLRETIAYTKRHCTDAEKEAAQMMKKADLLVMEHATDAYLARNNTYQKMLLEKKELYVRLEEVRKRLVHTESATFTSKTGMDMLSSQADELRAELQMEEKQVEKLQKFAEIYGVGLQDLESSVQQQYQKRELELLQLQLQINDLQEFISNLKQGIFAPKSAHLDALEQYLQNRYGDDICRGKDWIETLDAKSRQRVCKRIPYIAYAFVMKGDFALIQKDTVLADFGKSAYVVPIVSAVIAEDVYLETVSEQEAFVYKNPDFIKDSVKKQMQLENAQEEWQQLTATYQKYADRKEIVFHDYLEIQKLRAALSHTSKQKYEQLQQEMQRVRTEYEQHKKDTQQLTKEQNALSAQAEQIEKDIVVTAEQVRLLAGICRCNDTIAQDNKTMQTAREEQTDLEQELQRVTGQIAQANANVQQADLAWKQSREQKKKIQETQTLYVGAFYKENAENVVIPDVNMQDKEEMTARYEALRSQFFGIKEAMAADKNISDKEALLAHYAASMKKCEDGIKSAGYTLETVKAQAAQAISTQAYEEWERKLHGIVQECEQTEEALAAQRALMNRLEGSISHATGRYEEMYGTFATFACENVESYIVQHSQLVKKITQDSKALIQEQKAAEKEMRDFLLIEKDLTRAVEKAGMEVPEDVETVQQELDLADYENVQKEFDKLWRLEFKKLEEFSQKKEKVVQELEKLDAAELADEVRLSVHAPENVEKTKELVSRLKETNIFIALEKERIAKGIADMEGIKENFENRCIQTCCNIKTQLDRLPQMSVVTMDKEVIQMIGLHIPYIKEELYKAKMAEYIDETVTVAESFPTAAERLKYIRNRLSWKRLFSVIVTDMNGVTVNLYKRERIKDQSRYLRYEEAVGSTGQSQGIYIQFLIAIINYISSIYAAEKEPGVLHKTIFIDNPFGAAKDIYIWEPIFALLKANHVQLIVPARGATPAITGRFDVNYILGQKLVGNRQQTVVVDYHSQTKTEELEYTRMDYRQATFTWE